MNVTITAHAAAEDGSSEGHRFHFVAEDERTEPRSAVDSVGTASVIARELSGRMGLNAMMRAIVAAAPDQYDSLVGLKFDDE
jgi:hypothetical protein